MGVNYSEQYLQLVANKYHELEETVIRLNIMLIKSKKNKGEHNNRFRY